jgi:hypothetical protein
VPFAPGLQLDVTVHATAPLWRAEVLRWLLSDGGRVVYSHPFPPPSLPRGRHRLRIGWTGARIRARHRLTDWGGSLVVDGGRILGVEGWGFDHPENGVTGWSEHQVSWASETAGDWDGIVIDLEGDATTRLHFATEPTTFAFTPHDVANRPIVIDAGGVGQRVEVERDPGPTARSLSFSYPIADAPTNRDPYIVRITQQDGHVAWFSPIYVASAQR